MPSGYLTPVLDRVRRRQVIHNAIAALTNFKDQFDAIAVTGSSGLLVGPSIADALDKSLILVRKESDQSHSCLQIEHDIQGHNIRYLILDDMIASGDTLKRIYDRISDNSSPCHTYNYIGFYLYNQSQESVDYLLDRLPFHDDETHIHIGGRNE